MAPKPAPTRALQIHVTRHCNLECLHCYSRSGPSHREALDPKALAELISDAKSLGYTFTTLSGGEPFLYAHMAEVLGHAKSIGMSTGVVTNGMYLDARRLEPLKGKLDLIAVSLDGAPARHNRMRANDRAFQIMERKLPHLKASGIPFGFLFTLTRDNAHELEWAAEFAVKAGAALFQVHPLDLVGRAADTDVFDGLDPDEPAALMAARRAADIQKKYEGKIRVIVDYQPRLPEDFRASMQPCDKETRFADHVHPLCVETDGAIVPIGHGFNRSYIMGQLGEHRLLDMANAWKADGRAARYAELVAQTRAAADAETAPVLSNLAQEFRRASHAGAPNIVAA